MRRLPAALIAAILALSPIVAQAFGAKGHQMIGAIADRMLNPRASAQVNQLLGMRLRVAATWADCAKGVTRDGDAFRYTREPRFDAACRPFQTRVGIDRMHDFVRRNWNCAPVGATRACHLHYHFADVAIQRDRYDRAFAGTGDTDIVAAMRAAIGVLQERPSPAPIDIRGKPEALLLLAHLVGDVHQPLHVAAIYLDPRGRRVDPDAGPSTAAPRAGTRGGNSIAAGTSNLHAEWDQVASALSPASVRATMVADARRVARTAGDPLTWPATWASETVRDGHRAFDGITFAALAEQPGQWTATFDDSAAYEQMKREVQGRQLARAGARLAQLLNALWP
jgi:hypothetical protein